MNTISRLSRDGCSINSPPARASGTALRGTLNTKPPDRFTRGKGPNFTSNYTLPTQYSKNGSLTDQIAEMVMKTVFPGNNKEKNDISNQVRKITIQEELIIQASNPNKGIQLNTVV